MKFSKETAKKLAKQIHERFGAKIARAVEGTPVPTKFIAGLIAVEAGKKNGRIVEDATRFEPHVFAKLKQVRDGQLLQYNKIRRIAISDASDEALEALSKSYGLTQVMGYWSLRLDCTVADLRHPDKHLDYAVRLMLLNSNGDFEREEYVGEYRQWNSGSETGKTHDPDYVYNAGAVMAEYLVFELESPSVTETVTEEPKSEVKTQEPEPPAAPQAPKPSVTPVEAPPTSIATKIAAAASAAGPVIAATGLKIGGVEFKTGGLIAFAAVLIAGMIVGAWIWNQSQERRERRQRLSMEHLASDSKGNVIAAGSKV